jgi:DNA-directed RNA polymerase specialized sigma24 family protein
MDREATLLQLPPIYATALRLHEAGLSEDEIAGRLGMPAPEVPRLLRAAERRLRAVLSHDPGGPDANA